jgi:hypothetical protein
MRIILLGFFTLMGVNLFVTVMNSEMTSKMQERNEVLERLMSPPSTEIR